MGRGDSNMMPTEFDAVEALVGGGISCGIEDGSPKYTYHSGQTPPTESAIQSKLNELQAEYDALAWKRSRQAEYPPMEDQLDYMFHNGFDKWKEDIVQPVKDKYPKPE